MTDYHINDIGPAIDKLNTRLDKLNVRLDSLSSVVDQQAKGSSPLVMPFSYIGKKCIIRCYAAGVHYGTVEAHSGREVTLRDARRLWEWHTGGKENGISLSGVARNGIDAKRSKVEPVLDGIVLLDALEIIPCEDPAVKSIEAA